MTNDRPVLSSEGAPDIDKHVTRKRRLKLNGINGVISQKMILFKHVTV
jgi:hypothetical protein